jgi:hypothetical protein
MIIAFIQADVILQPDALNINHIQPNKRTRNIQAGAWQDLILWYTHISTKRFYNPCNNRRFWIRCKDATRT